MNIGSWMVWGFIATLILTVSLSLSQGMKFTRMNIPFLLGTIVTPNRDKAKLVGILIHILNGLIFSLGYVAVFHLLGNPSWIVGAAIGVVHATFVLAVVLPNLSGIHPRMASEHSTLTHAKLLEPPGFWALNYGFQTPVSVIIAHIIFGIILGSFYTF